MKWLAKVAEEISYRTGASWVSSIGSGAGQHACKPQLCHSPAIVTVPTENILKRDTCAPPFGYQTVVPKELEFPQESHAGSRKRSGVCKKGNRDFTQL